MSPPRAPRAALRAVAAVAALLASACALPLAPGRAAAGEARLDLSASTLRFSEFPHPLEDATGAVLLSSGVVSLDPLAFRVFASPFTARGFFVPGKRLYDLRLVSPGVAPADLPRLLPDLPLFRAVSPVAVDVRFARDGTGETRVFRVAAKEFRVDGSGVSNRFGELSGRDLAASGWVRGKRRFIENLSFGIFDGAFSYRGDAEAFRASLEGARLERALEGRPALAGKLRGAISVTVRREGEAVFGRFRATDGEARDFAFLAALSRALRVKRLSTLAFSECSASFRRQGDSIDVKDLVVRSEIADLSAHLSVTGREGRLAGGGRLVVRLKVVAESGKLKRWGILKDVLRRNSLTLKVRIRGTLDDPDLDVAL